MKIPTTLKHKPVIVSENYENVDGRYAYNSDSKGLSLGLAQWNDRGKVEISAKVWRHTGEKWSRQSEELLFTGSWTWPFLFVGHNYISRKLTGLKIFMTKTNPLLIGLACKGMP